MLPILFAVWVGVVSLYVVSLFVYLLGFRAGYVQRQREVMQTLADVIRKPS